MTGTPILDIMTSEINITNIIVVSSSTFIILISHVIFPVHLRWRSNFRGPADNNNDKPLVLQVCAT